MPTDALYPDAVWTLLRRVAEGDRTAWAEVVERHARDAYRVAVGILGDHHLAEDACQDAFLRVGRHADQFRGDSDEAARAWILRTVSRVALMAARQRRRARRRAQPLPEEPTSAPPTYAPDPRRLDLLRLALAALPAAQRELLALHFLAGQDYEQIARTQRITVNHARVRVHRALTVLRGRLVRSGLADLPLVALLPQPHAPLPAALVGRCLARWPAGAAQIPLPQGLSPMMTVGLGGAMLAATAILVGSVAHVVAEEPAPPVVPAPHVAFPGAGGVAQVPASFQALQGSWRADGVNQGYLRFAPKKAWVINDGKVFGTPMGYAHPGMVFLPFLDEARYQIEGDVLSIRDGDDPTGKAMRFRRLAGEPPGFSLAPLPLPQAQPLDDATRRDDERAIDTWYHLEFDAAPGGREDARINGVSVAAALGDLLRHVGWIDCGRFSPEKSRMACALARSSAQPALILAATAAARADALAHRVDGATYAELADAAAGVLAEPQEYGTAVRWEDHQAHVLLRDPDHVDVRRAALGLPPLRASLAQSHPGTPLVLDAAP